jgi:hypothetical protein
MNTRAAAYQPFDDIRGKWAARVNMMHTSEYTELNEDTVRLLIADYCASLGVDGSVERKLRLLTEVALGSVDIPPELIRNVVDLFFELKGKRDRGELLYDAGTIVPMQGLMNPRCPVDVLTRACFSPYPDFAWAAEMNPMLPVEDQVRCALMRGGTL